MCIEDIAIARRCYKVITRLAAGTARRLPANPDRIAVRLSCDANTSSIGTISPTETDATSGNGYKSSLITLPVAGVGVGYIDLVMDYRNDGPAVQDELWVFVDVGSPFVVETIMQEELAAEVSRVASKWGK